VGGESLLSTYLPTYGKYCAHNRCGNAWRSSPRVLGSQGGRRRGGGRSASVARARDECAEDEWWGGTENGKIFFRDMCAPPPPPSFPYHVLRAPASSRAATLCIFTPRAPRLYVAPSSPFPRLERGMRTYRARTKCADPCTVSRPLPLSPGAITNAFAVEINTLCATARMRGTVSMKASMTSENLAFSLA